MSEELRLSIGQPPLNIVKDGSNYEMRVKIVEKWNCQSVRTLFLNPCNKHIAKQVNSNLPLTACAAVRKITSDRT
jgi:predicted thioredoxin/glutaredoxin